MNILVVDDEAEFPALYKDYLSSFGHTVSTASSVKDALVIFAEDSFDLVITDMVMPGKSGIDLAREIRVVNTDIQIMMISAFMTDVQEKDATIAGVNFCLSKPLKLKELKAIVNRIATDVTKEQHTKKSEFDWKNLFNLSSSKNLPELAELIGILKSKNISGRELSVIVTMIREWISLISTGTLDDSLEMHYAFAEETFCLSLQNLPESFSLESDGTWKYPLYLSKNVMGHLDYDANKKRLLMEKKIGG